MVSSQGDSTSDATVPSPSWAAGPLHALPSGHRLGEFQIERVLGEGGFGIVYLAADVQLERQVALKEYMPASLARRAVDLSVVVRSESARPTFELGLRSFVNEARILAQLDHPALVKVHHFWEERGTAYMVMPYYPGLTLKQALRSMHPPPDEAWLRTLLEPLLDVLAYLHSQNIYHRDVSPDNIVLLSGGRPVLLDFGAARRIVGDGTQDVTAILKPGYAPIEQYAGSAAARQGAWTDIYALAAVLYFVVGGKAPVASVARLVQDDMTSAVRLGQGRYSQAFLEGIDACLAVLPEHRPRDVATARHCLGEQAGQVGVEPLPAAPPPEPVSMTIPASPGRAGAFAPWGLRWPWAAAALVVVTGAGVLAWFMGAGTPAQRDLAPAASSAATVAASALPQTRPATDTTPNSSPRVDPPGNAATPAQAVPVQVNGAATAMAPLAKTQASAPVVRRPEAPVSTAACADLLQRLSLGQDNEALRQQMASLHCQ